MSLSMGKLNRKISNTWLVMSYRFLSNSIHSITHPIHLCHWTIIIHVYECPSICNHNCMIWCLELNIQEDIVNDMLTVRENIQFSAALRLSSNISQGKRNQQVNDIIDELELTSCADNRVWYKLLHNNVRLTVHLTVLKYISRKHQ